MLDLTKPYHNLLAVEEEEKQQNFYWDFGVAVIEENGGLSRSYLQDEMGSPLRILYGNGNGDIGMMQSAGLILRRLGSIGQNWGDL